MSRCRLSRKPFYVVALSLSRCEKIVVCPALLVSPNCTEGSPAASNQYSSPGSSPRWTELAGAGPNWPDNETALETWLAGGLRTEYHTDLLYPLQSSRFFVTYNILRNKVSTSSTVVVFICHKCVHISGFKEPN